MIVIVVVVSLSDAISGLRLPDWTELRNLEAVLSLSRSSRSYSFTLRSSSVFVSGLFEKLHSKSAIVEKGRDLT